MFLHFLHWLLGLLPAHITMASLWNRPNGPGTIAAQSSGQAGLNVQAQINPMMPVTLSLTSTSETTVPHPQNSSIALILPLSPNEGNEQIPFDLVISGYIQTTNTTNVTVLIRSGTSLTPGSNTQLATSGAIALNTAIAPFMMQLHMIYDSVSGKMGGWFEGVVNNSLVARAALSNVLTGIKDTNNPVVNFVASFTSSAASAGNPTTCVIKAFTAG